jgi:RsiW-degrading membrane proteinase PrsW (M82 family)
MPAYPIYLLTLLFAAAMVLWVYRMDRFEREPWWAVFVAVAVGFGAMWLIGQGDDFALQTLRLAHEDVATRAAVVALIEEGGKLLTVLALANVFLWRQFNDPMDGLIYGRLAGLGMAVNESMLYLSLAPPTLQTLGREIVRLFGHSLMCALVGFAIGIGARPGGRPRKSYPMLAVGCLTLSTFLHFAWNLTAYAPQGGITERLVPMMVMLALMVLWRWLSEIAEAKSKQVFAEAAAG